VHRRHVPELEVQEKGTLGRPQLSRGLLEGQPFNGFAEGRRVSTDAHRLIQSSVLPLRSRLDKPDPSHGGRTVSQRIYRGWDL